MQPTPVDSPRRLPVRGPGRPAALSALQAVIVADTQSTLDLMVAEGWPVDAAIDCYRSWFLTLVSSAIDEGLGEWVWRGPT